MQIFSTKNTDISKIKRALVLKGIFSETTYVCVLRTKFQVPPHPPPLATSKRTPTEPNHIRVKKKSILTRDKQVSCVGFQFHFLFIN